MPEVWICDGESTTAPVGAAPPKLTIGASSSFGPEIVIVSPTLPLVADSVGTIWNAPGLGALVPLGVVIVR